MPPYARTTKGTSAFRRERRPRPASTMYKFTLPNQRFGRSLILPLRGNSPSPLISPPFFAQVRGGIWGCLPTTRTSNAQYFVGSDPQIAPSISAQVRGGIWGCLPTRTGGIAEASGETGPSRCRWKRKGRFRFRSRAFGGPSRKQARERHSRQGGLPSYGGALPAAGRGKS